MHYWQGIIANGVTQYVSLWQKVVWHLWPDFTTLFSNVFWNYYRKIILIIKILRISIMINVMRFKSSSTSELFQISYVETWKIIILQADWQLQMHITPHLSSVQVSLTTKVKVLAFLYTNSLKTTKEYTFFFHQPKYPRSDKISHTICQTCLQCDTQSALSTHH